MFQRFHFFLSEFFNHSIEMAGNETMDTLYLRAYIDLLPKSRSICYESLMNLFSQVDAVNYYFNGILNWNSMNLGVEAQEGLFFSRILPV